MTDSLPNLLLSVADDKLVLGHGNSEWTGLAPILEEDIAFSSLAQDEIAHAQALYALAGGLLGVSADQLAYGPAPADYRCATIVELPDDFDWAFAVVRRFLCDHFDRLRLERLSRSSNDEVAALATRLAAEEQVHVDHFSGWLPRLVGTDEARTLLQAAWDRLAPFAPMLFEPVDGEAELESAGVYPGDRDAMYAAWLAAMRAVTDGTGLVVDLPETPPAADVKGGRHGEHTEHLAALLEEMTEVWRVEPNAAW